MGHRHAHHDHAVDLEKRKNDVNEGAATVVSIVYVTAEPTFEGPVGGYVTVDPDATKTAANVGVGPAVRPTQTAKAITTDDVIPPKAEETTQTAQRAVETAITTDNDKAPATLTSFSTATLAAVATSALSSAGLDESSAATSSYSAGTSSALATASAAAAASGSGGMSGGAKAGIAIGVILGVGLMAGLLLFWLHKKKQSQKMAQAEDSEKTFGSAPAPLPPAPPPMVKSESITSAKPPQLNVRPVTQFAPDLSPSTSGVSLGAVAAGAAVGTAATAAATRNLTSNPLDDRSYTGAAHNPPQTPSKSSVNSQNPFNDPVNPFENQADAPSPSAAVNSTGPHPVSPTASAAAAAHVSGVVPSGTALEVAGAGAAVAGAAMVATVSSASSSEKDLTVHTDSGPTSPATVPPGPVSPVSAVSADAVSVGSGNVAAFAAVGPGPNNVHRVQMDFSPSMDDELELRSGQLVRMLHEYDDGWALCIRLDRSQQGVAPRSCLSSRPVKPRNGPPHGPGPRGPPMMGPNGRPMSPAGGRMPPGPPMANQPPRFYPQDGRPMSPARPGFSGPPPPRPPQQGRPMSPAQFPPVPQSMSPGPGPRVGPPRSMSPGPYGPPGMQKPSMPINQRQRSNSAGGAIGPNPRMNGAPKSSPLAGSTFQPMQPLSAPPTGPLPQIQPQIQRKPVGDQDMPVNI